MNAIITIIPILLIRYGLLSAASKEATKRAAFFAPLSGKEKPAYAVYQITTALMLLYLLLLKIRTDSIWFSAGLAVYFAGLVLYTASILNYAKPKKNGINSNGLYKVSRNPMYIAYFICFLGCVILTRSWLLFVLLLIFQISAHWIILSEERWCIKTFGAEYTEYMNQVRRYL